MNVCQKEYESFPPEVVSEKEKARLGKEELSLLIRERKDKMLAFLKFLGHLLVRKLLGSGGIKIMYHVVSDLIGPQRANRTEWIEGVCELLQVVGHDLDNGNIQHGRIAHDQMFNDLRELKDTAAEAAAQSMIGDLLDLRAHNWKAKLEPSGRVITVKISKQDEGLGVVGHFLSGEIALPNEFFAANTTPTLFDLRCRIAQELNWNQGVELLDGPFLRRIPSQFHLAMAYSDIVAKEMKWKPSSDEGYGVETIGGEGDIRDVHAWKCDSPSSLDSSDAADLRSEQHRLMAKWGWLTRRGSSDASDD
jgi:hypothetical protein